MYEHRNTERYIRAINMSRLISREPAGLNYYLGNVTLFEERLNGGHENMSTRSDLHLTENL